MSAGDSWHGNWPARLYECVREHGYTSLTAFADAHPAISLVELTEMLGKGRFSAVQVFSGLVEEAERSHQLVRLMRGQLVRELSESFPNGWPAGLDDDARLEAAMMLASWIGFTPETHKERARQVTATLLANPPPAGWRPLSHDDELLRTLLPDDTA
ncbi:NUDIX hydrolase [Myxococcus llanfairpwllgwyngyllgogerychwyrndrobwllllantysiliogogogochensis]|uniref:NUDIX hydrolase n=1 Tax=Myxococcus llanfairpwllgwyngyllgogerychwyrndrobwllllantysiliogogogochensis TaxID=2590453 RepID=A0A540WR33_9BACT|nr:MULTISPECIES: NUDIX hydrolase [Myxococcus]NTX56969.1 NUDIX hydrolase [Myxococcus sp. CA039A]TQF11486.1 NUDIX hydrolase [Myxococcus llanfairpwllgwyngyllgogerychwyrndrobwllllantysiliogogogochensis]